MVVFCEGLPIIRETWEIQNIRTSFVCKDGGWREMAHAPSKFYFSVIPRVINGCHISDGIESQSIV